MQQSMKTMNVIMPLMSAWFCLTLPAGMGLYWVVGAVVRSIQQIAINKHIDKMDIEAEIEKNVEKYKEKTEKTGSRSCKIASGCTDQYKEYRLKDRLSEHRCQTPCKDRRGKSRRYQKGYRILQ